MEFGLFIAKAIPTNAHRAKSRNGNDKGVSKANSTFLARIK